jgi:uncharacterized integral membrane protein
VARFKIILALVVALLLGIVIIQNSEPVEAKLVFFTIEMSRSVLLGLAMLGGFVVGLVAAFYIAGKRR